MRKTLFKVHNYLALAAAIPLLLIVFTGSLLVFKFELDSVLMPEVVTVDRPGEARPGFNELISQVNQDFPGYEIGSWEFFHDGDEADRVYLIKKGGEHWYKIHLDPYSGKALNTPVLLNDYLTDWLLELHYTLLLNERFESMPHLGVILGLLFAIILCLLGITGLIIYRKFWKKLFTLRWGKGMTTVTRSLHRLFGIWCSPVLLIIGLTGVYFNLIDYLEEAKEHAEGGHYILDERLYNDQLDFDALYRDSQTRMAGFTPTYLLMPYEPGLSITFYGEVPFRNPFVSQYASTVSYTPDRGEFEGIYDIREVGFVMQLVDSFRTLHFGNFGGILSKLIWCVAGLVMSFLAISGCYMWATRKLKRRKRSTLQMAEAGT